MVARPSMHAGELARVLVLTDSPARLALAVRALVRELAEANARVSARTLVLLLEDDALEDLELEPVVGAESREPLEDLEQRSGTFAVGAAVELLAETPAERRKRLDRERKRNRRTSVPASSISGAGAADMSAPDADNSADASANVRSVRTDKAEMSAAGADMPAPPAGPPALTKSFDSSSVISDLVSSASASLVADLEITPDAETSRAREAPGTDGAETPVDSSSPPAVDSSSDVAPPASSPPSSGRRRSPQLWGLVSRFARIYARVEGRTPVFADPTRYAHKDGKPPNAHARHLLYDGALYALQHADRVMARAPVDERCNIVADAFEAHVTERPWKEWPHFAVLEVDAALKRRERAARVAEEAAARAAAADAPKPDPVRAASGFRRYAP